MDEFVVSAAMRRRGIGGELLERATGRARSLGCKRVEVAWRDSASKTFLEKRGFATIGAEVLSWLNRDAK